MRIGRSLIAAALVVAAAGMVIEVAGASFRGKNGLVAFDDGSVFPSRIGVVNPDGSGETTLTQQGDHWPRWSADGKKIVFFSTRDGDGEILVMNADGTGQTQLTSNTVEDQVPEWTSDGRIVFGRRAGPSHWDIWIMNADGSGQRQLTDLGAVSVWPTPSPSANEVAFSSNFEGNFHVYTMQLDGSHLQQVTPDDTVDWGPDWSPSGNDLAFIRETIAPSTSAGVDEDVWVIHANGTQPIQLTADPARADTFPTWSPDGRYVIFYAATDWFGPDWHSTITSINVKSGVESTIGRPDIGGAPSWQPLAPSDE